MAEPLAAKTEEPSCIGNPAPKLLPISWLLRYRREGKLQLHVILNTAHDRHFGDGQTIVLVQHLSGRETCDLAAGRRSHLHVEGLLSHRVADGQVAGYLERESVAHVDRFRQSLDCDRREGDVLVRVLLTLQNELLDGAVASIGVGCEVAQR